MLQLGAAPLRRALVSDAQSMAVNGVSSDIAKQLSGGLWDAYAGDYGSAVPEVPSDGERFFPAMCRDGCSH